jgi:hypothetical protein
VSYLEEAAALLRKSAEANEKPRTTYGSERSDREINEGRERIAMKFAQLGAIEHGVFPTELAAEMVRDLRGASS